MKPKVDTEKLICAVSDKPDSFLRNDGKEAPEGILVRSPVLAVESRGRDLASRNQVSGEASVHSVTAAQCSLFINTRPVANGE